MMFQDQVAQRKKWLSISVVAGVIATMSVFSGPGFFGFGGGDEGRRLQVNGVTYDHSEEMELPAHTANMANVWDPLQNSDQAFFWYVGKSGGLTWQKIVAECLELTSASARGFVSGQAIDVFKGPDNGLYVNVDPSTRVGINRAADLKLVESGMADIYFSEWLVYSSKLFSGTHKARMFVMFRHPTKRIIDQFYYKQRETWVGERKYDVDLGEMSLAQFVVSDKMVENFMVRSLVNLETEIDVTKEHVDLAKDILRRKFLVGILDWFDLSIVRFEKYFGYWDTKEVALNAEINYCHYQKIHNGDQIGNIPKWTMSDDPYKKLSIRNWADIELYVYAKHLFVEQAALVD